MDNTGTDQAHATRLPWYAVRTKSNCEKTVAQTLASKGITTYLPEYRSRRETFGRITEGYAPLFPGYVFCRVDTTERVPVISTPAVVAIVGFGNDPAPIPDSEIEAVQAMLSSGVPVEVCGYLREGQRVRIRKGPFQNVEGTLVTKKSESKFVVSVSLLQRSVAVEFDPAWLGVA